MAFSWDYARSDRGGTRFPDCVPSLLCRRSAGQYDQEHSCRDLPADGCAGEEGRVCNFLSAADALFDEARERGYISAGFCPGNYGYMMKRVLAMAGDVVTSTDAGMSVNGEVLQVSTPLTKDKAGRIMPRYSTDSYTLKESELLLMSDVSGTSFDGRYFGPVDAGQVREVIKPLVTF
ncbi:conjugative transfer signal peptidase TraF [Nitrosospira multiformis]|uniref:Conjugative transfer signal peptidase TraF n=1 Tax=Nitrosospira multiformis TaxID=1231 RepID=A0A1H8NN89_9PROT|nr:conjugative transfer signal peptidase TraF [Nitrosospira multiformis]SEO30848.1 conjugative transfer signal peptidase TraF [Nitrosospira multiformis]